MSDAFLFAILLLSPIALATPIVIAWTIRPGAEWVRKLAILAVIGLGISLAVASYILYKYTFIIPISGEEYHRIVIPWIPDLGLYFSFIIDELSKVMGFLTAFIAFIIGVYGLEYMAHDYRLGFYWFFFNLFTASMLTVAYADNLMCLFIGWEGLGIASWGLIAHWFRDDDELTFVGYTGRRVKGIKMWWVPSFSGYRAITTVRFGDMPMFFSIAAIYVLTYLLGHPTLELSQIPWEELLRFIGPFGTFTLLFMFLLGPLTKSAQLPFTDWLMTAMTGPTTVSALLHSATMVAAGAYLFMKLTWYIGINTHWKFFEIPGLDAVYVSMLFVGFVTALVCSFIACGCLERKVLLAASTAASLGLMFGITATAYWTSMISPEFGMFSVMVAFWYLVTHAFAKACLFLVAGHLIHVTETRFSVGDWKFTRTTPLMTWAFIITVIATTCLGGLPLLTAYWVKAGMDAVIHGIAHVAEHLPEAYSIAVAAFCLYLLTSLTYAAFLAKFLSLNFVKGEHPHHVHAHGGYVMAFGYSVLGLALIALLITYVGGYTHYFAEFIHHGSEPIAVAIGLLCLISYLVALYRPRIQALAKVGEVLHDRLYLPVFCDVVMGSIGWGFAKGFWGVCRGIDWWAHNGMIRLFKWFSNLVRSIQRGYLSVYIRIVLGVILAVTLIFTITYFGISLT